MAATTRCRTIVANPVPSPDLNSKEPYMTLCGPLGNAAMYTYCSQPKPVQERPKYRNGIAKPRGAHDYFNVMFDPHVYRGSEYTTIDQFDLPKAEELCCLANKRKGHHHVGGGDSRKMSRRQSRQIGGILIPSTPPREGKNNQLIQTDTFLEELIGSIEEIDGCTQTDAIHEMLIPESYIPAKFGLDVSTQIEPCELFDFNREVCPIVENMVNKVLEQALIEVMEEEELKALRDQQQAYNELRRKELLRLKRLAEREQKVQQEQQRLMHKLHEEHNCEVEAEARIGSYLFASNYLKGKKVKTAVFVDHLDDLLPNTMECLRRDGYLQNRAELFSDLVPWLNEAVTVELQNMDISRLLLDDILRHVTNSRQRDMAASLFSEPDPEPQPISQELDNLVAEDDEYF